MASGESPLLLSARREAQGSIAHLPGFTLGYTNVADPSAQSRNWEQH